MIVATPLPASSPVTVTVFPSLSLTVMVLPLTSTLPPVAASSAFSLALSQAVQANSNDIETRMVRIAAP